MSLVADFGRAVAQLRDPRFLGVLLKALAITVIGLALVFWAVMAGLGWLLPESVALPWIGPVRFLDDLASLAAVGLMLVLSVVLMVPTAAAVVGFFLEEVAEAVEAEHYPGLAPVAGPGLSAQIGDALRFFALVVAVNLAALVVYLLLPPLAPFVFWLVNGFLLGREYFQLVAMRRLGPEGAARLRRANAGRIWLAGTAMAVPLSVPVLNLLVPILGVAVFTHQLHRMAPAS
ncbi:MAG: EI24 domain-containing protein [Rhodovulum sp.]|nr:EI24 domain-containing protein [Rhodovulum sp.]